MHYHNISFGHKLSQAEPFEILLKVYTFGGGFGGKLGHGNYEDISKPTQVMDLVDRCVQQVRA